MAYKMTDIKDGLRIGKRSDGMFDLEYTSGVENESETGSLIMAPEDAKEIAHYILNNA